MHNRTHQDWNILANVKIRGLKPGYVEFEVSGGLGNQILCLAAALCYSEKAKASCRLNLGRYFDPIGLRREHPGHSYRGFELNNFELTSASVSLSTTKSTLRYVRRIHFAKRLRTGVQKKLGRFLRTYFISDGNLENIPNSLRTSLLVWGNFLRFSNVERAKELGLEKLTLLQKSPQYSEFENMREPNAIVVHIRLGDYIETYPELLLGVDYYLAACRKLTKLGALRKVYVFSDDSSLARDFFNQPEFLEFEINYPEIEQDFSPSEVFTYIRESKFIVGSCSTFSGIAVILGSENSVAILPRKILDLFGTIEVLRKDIYLLESSN